jgi:hypothetical protein
VREEQWLRTFKNRVLMNIFGHRRDELRDYCRRVHDEKLYDFCSHQIFFGRSKPAMRWNRHVERVGKRRGAYRFLDETLRDRDHLEEPSVDERIIQNGSCRRWMGRHGRD